MSKRLTEPTYWPYKPKDRSNRLSAERTAVIILGTLGAVGIAAGYGLATEKQDYVEPLLVSDSYGVTADKNPDMCQFAGDIVERVTPEKSSAEKLAQTCIAESIRLGNLPEGTTVRVEVSRDLKVTAIPFYNEGLDSQDS